MSLFDMFGTKTVASITSKLSSMVTELEQHEADSRQRAQDLSAEIVKMQADQVAQNDEADKANRVKAKIAELLA